MNSWPKLEYIADTTIPLKVYLSEVTRREKMPSQSLFPSHFQLDVIGHIDTLLILLSPRQVNLLLDLFGAFSSGGKGRWVKYWLLLCASTVHMM